MVTFGATEKPYFAFICRTELAKPPDCKVVFALGAFYLDGRHGFCLSFLFHNHDLILAALDPALHLIGVINLPDIPAFPAFQLASRRYKHGLAFRTEHRYRMRNHRRLTLLLCKLRDFLKTDCFSYICLSGVITADYRVLLQNPFFGIG
jgi:hypothetical protein